MTSPRQNQAIWQRLYAEGKADLQYPSEPLVRLGHRMLDKGRHQRVLDFGFGTGANLLHLAKRGFEMHGVEISRHALERANSRLQGEGLSAALQLLDPGARLPYQDCWFDVVVAWQVLYYNDWESLAEVTAELRRVLRPGGLLIASMAAPGDVSQQLAEPLGNSVYRSSVPGQEGCIVLIPGESELLRYFPGEELSIGRFGLEFGELVSRHWLVSFVKG